MKSLVGILPSANAAHLAPAVGRAWRCGRVCRTSSRVTRSTPASRTSRCDTGSTCCSRTWRTPGRAARLRGPAAPRSRPRRSSCRPGRERAVLQGSAVRPLAVDHCAVTGARARRPAASRVSESVHSCRRGLAERWD